MNRAAFLLVSAILLMVISLIGCSPAPPVVITNDATDITIDSATLNGSMDSLGDYATIDVSFVWGPDSETDPANYPNETTPQPKTSTGDFSAALSGLLSNTTYFFRTKVTGSVTVYGDEFSFTTKMRTVVTEDATNITATEARLNGDLDDMGTASSVSVSFVWSTTSGGPYPNETTSQTTKAPIAFAFRLTGLTPDTTYYFQAKALGDDTAYGTEKSFVTLTTPPIVVTEDATNITATEARLNGDLDDMGTASSVSVSFVWSTTSGGPYSNDTTPQILSAPRALSFDLTGLTPGTRYYFQAKALGDGTAYGAEKSFTTLVPVTFPDSNLEAVIREVIGKPEGQIYTSDLEVLTTLESEASGISDITGLEYCTNLREIRLGDNYINDLSPLSGLTNLKLLWIWTNNINDISPLANLVNLQELNFVNNNVSDLSPLSGLTNLYSLGAAQNNISDITPLAGLWSLKYLNLLQNNISDLSPLANLTKLEHLFLDNNNISDVTSIANLVNLRWLFLHNNNISDLSPLTNLTKLERLFLENNNINDVSPLVENSGLREGDQVFLGNNPLSATSVNVYIPQLEERGVTVHH